MQQRLEEANEDEKQVLFSEIVGSKYFMTGEPNSHRLMKDVFGNYVVQKMFEFGSPNQRKQLFYDLRGSIYDLSCDQYGCRVIQKALDVLPSRRGRGRNQAKDNRLR
jgi:pumilio RNA-binding family